MSHMPVAALAAEAYWRALAGLNELQTEPASPWREALIHLLQEHIRALSHLLAQRRNQ